MKRKIMFLLLICNLITVCAFTQTIRYVKPAMTGTGDGSSWANASGSIQTMINSSTAGDQVWIAGGEYALSATLTMKGGVNVYGGFLGFETDINQRYKEDLDENGIIESWEFAYATILNGQNQRQVLNQASNFTVETVWDGVTIKGGKVNAASYQGGGAFVQVNGKLVNCIVTENSVAASASNANAASYGGGIYNNGGIISNCLVVGNTVTASFGTSTIPAYYSAYSRGGGIYNNDGIITNCTISGNSTSSSTASNSGYLYSLGGGICCANTTTSIVSDCVVKNNQILGSGSSSNNRRGGGIYEGNVSRCIIRENSARDGGGLYGSMVSNCLIVNNTALFSGGGHYAIANNSIINSTFVENTATMQEGGGIYTNSSITVSNCIFWKNNAPTGEQIVGGIVIYSAVQGGYSGMGNISIAENNEIGGAMFVNPTENNFQLQEGSPCIDAGSNAMLSNTDTLDLAGNPRICNIVDMGAYELILNCIVSVTNITNVPNTAIIGTPLTLTGTVNPSNATNQTIVWSVSNAGGTNATIIGNTFFATEAGTAIITATIIDGVAMGVNYTQDFQISVIQSNDFIAVIGITDVPNTATVNTPLTLTGTVNPSNATNQTIVWSIANAGTTEATITGNTFLATEAGTAVIMATITNGTAIGTDYTQGFYIMVNSVGITEPAQTLNLKVYPNPTTGELRIVNETLQRQADCIHVQIFDIYGRKVGINTQVLPENTENEIVIDISHLPNGMYFLRVENDIVKIVKK